MPKSHTHSNDFKWQVAQAACDYIKEPVTIGVGTGRTVNCFIELLSQKKDLIEACVASSVDTERRLKAQGFLVLDLPTVNEVTWYVDSADEVNPQHQMIKGGGGAMTREKIIATASKTFVCMIEPHKWVKHLGQFPVATEVLPMARSLVGRALVALGCDPVYRQGFVTDNGNIILDVYCDPDKLSQMETAFKQMTGVVDSGLFLQRRADIVLCGGSDGVTISAIKVFS